MLNNYVCLWILSVILITYIFKDVNLIVTVRPGDSDMYILWTLNFLLFLLQLFINSFKSPEPTMNCCVPLWSLVLFTLKLCSVALIVTPQSAFTWKTQFSLDFKHWRIQDSYPSYLLLWVTQLHCSWLFSLYFVFWLLFTTKFWSQVSQISWFQYKQPDWERDKWEVL